MRFLGPDQLDTFCRTVLAEIAVYRDAVLSGSPKAAHEKLNKTPQAVGQSLQRMQEHLSPWLNGGALFDPSVRKSIRTTDAGDFVLHFAEKVLTDADGFVRDLDAIQNHNQVRLASIHSAWMAYGPELQKAFAKCVDGGIIDGYTIGGTGYPEKIVAEVRERRADVGITSYPPANIPPTLAFQPFKDRAMILVFSAKYPRLPKGNRPLRLKKLIRADGNLKIAIHHRGFDSPLGNQIFHYLNREDVFTGMTQLSQATNIADIKEIVMRFPDTITILPEDAVTQEIADGRMMAYRLAPTMKPWDWGCVYRKGVSRPAVAQFIECLRPLFKDSPHRKPSRS